MGRALTLAVEANLYSVFRNYRPSMGKSGDGSFLRGAGGMNLVFLGFPVIFHGFPLLFLGFPWISHGFP